MGSRWFVSVGLAERLALAVAMTFGLTAASRAEFGIGSQAPILDIEHWVQKGGRDAGFEPVTDFAAGTIYVIEFWATWCPPCRTSMPHLAALQRKFADQGVTIVSVSDEDLDTVMEFLDTKAADGRTYREITAGSLLTADPDGSVSKSYMEASGQRGIPTAFVVGRTGVVEWIGHPLEMDDPLERIVAGTFDREAAALAARETRELEARIPQLVALVQGGDEEEALDLLDGWLADMTSPQARAWIASTRRRIAIRSSGPRAVEAFREAVDEADGAAEQLNELAWDIELRAARGGDVAEELLAAAVDAAERGVAAAPHSSDVLDTLAHLLARQGKLDEALAMQRRAVEWATDEIRGPVEGYLEELETLAVLGQGGALPIDAEAAGRHVGELCRVTMRVASGRLLNPTRCFLNSQSDHRDDRNFTAVLLEPGLQRFAADGVPNPADHFLGRTVQVTGMITLHRERPQIVVRLPAQIEVAAESAEAETPAGWVEP